MTIEIPSESSGKVVAYLIESELLRLREHSTPEVLSSWQDELDESGNVQPGTYTVYETATTDEDLNQTFSSSERYVMCIEDYDRVMRQKAAVNGIQTTAKGE